MDFKWLHTDSTNAGIAVILGAAAAYFSGQMSATVALTTAFGGLVAILLPTQVPPVTK